MEEYITEARAAVDRLRAAQGLPPWKFGRQRKHHDSIFCIVCADEFERKDVIVVSRYICAACAPMYQRAPRLSVSRKLAAMVDTDLRISGRLTPIGKAQALELLLEGFPLIHVAKVMGMSRSTIQGLRQRSMHLFPTSCDCGKPFAHRGHCSPKYRSQIVTPGAFFQIIGSGQAESQSASI